MKEQMTYVAIDTDNVGESVGNAVLQDDEVSLSSLSESINAGTQIFSQWAEYNGGEVLSIEKDVEQSEKDYVSVVKKVKKENITPENIAEIMLCQIPGISSVTALAIMDKFKTLPNLIQEVQQLHANYFLEMRRL